MLSIAQEQSHLARAEQDVVDGERRIAAQGDLVERLRRHGHPFELAETLLVTFEETLKIWRAHRDEIRRVLAKLEAV